MGFSGTGDLSASVICGSLVKGLPIQKAVEKTTYFLQEAIEEATKEEIEACQKIADDRGIYLKIRKFS